MESAVISSLKPFMTRAIGPLLEVHARGVSDDLKDALELWVGGAVRVNQRAILGECRIEFLTLVDERTSSLVCLGAVSLLYTLTSEAKHVLLVKTLDVQANVITKHETDWRIADLVLVRESETWTGIELPGLSESGVPLVHLHIRGGACSGCQDP